MATAQKSIPTEMELFDTSAGSSVEEEAEQISKQQSSKKSKGAPVARVRLSQQEKMKLVHYHLANPLISQKELIDWCFKKFDMKKRLSVGAMCGLLKPANVARFKQLHENEINAYVLNSKSSKGGLFPDLETELFSWFRRNETKHAALTDDIVRDKAKSIAADLKIPKFEASAHWIQRFKKRHGISQLVLHGEAGSADKIYIEVARAVLPKLLAGSSLHDIYNFDETGNNFRTLPIRTLGSQPRQGLKVAKDRVTVALCTNATGTHKLKPLVIGSAKKPRCFGASWDPERDAKVVYDSNKSSWMERSIFEKWITAFNEEMQGMGKTAWLLLDNSSTHSIPAGCTGKIWEVLTSLRGFEMSNTKVVFLPPNTTSHIQPLDGGIIQSFKCGYRRFHIRWVIAEIDSGRAANAEKARPDLRLAIEWIRSAWNDVTPITIKNCWNKVKILPVEQVVPQDSNDMMKELASMLVEFSTSSESLQIDDLLNPADEQWVQAPVESDDEDAALVEAIKARAEQDAEDDDDSEPVVPMTLKEAREMFVKGKNFLQENQTNASLQKYLAPVEGLVRALEAMTFSARSRQTDIAAFLVPLPARDPDSVAAGAAGVE